MSVAIGRRKILDAEAAALRERAASWHGPSGAFVRAEAARFNVTTETIRRILRGETHLGLTLLAQPAAAAGVAPAPAFPWAGEVAEPANPEAALASDESARRLLESLGSATGDAVVDAFREAFGEEPAEAPARPTPELPSPESPNLG